MIDLETVPTGGLWKEIRSRFPHVVLGFMVPGKREEDPWRVVALYRGDAVVCLGLVQHINRALLRSMPLVNDDLSEFLGDEEEDEK